MFDPSPQLANIEHKIIEPLYNRNWPTGVKDQTLIKFLKNIKGPPALLESLVHWLGTIQLKNVFPILVRIFSGFIKNGIGQFKAI